MNESWHAYLANDLGALTAEAKGYWTTYGGWRAIGRSPAFMGATIITVLCEPFWHYGDWASITISVVPCLLGFTLGAMAVVLAFPNTKLFRFLSEGGRPDSYYLDLASKFVHFIVIQVFSILISLIGKSYCAFLLSFLGFVLLVYAVLCAAMTAFALFGVAQIYNHPGTPESGGEDDFNS